MSDTRIGGTGLDQEDVAHIRRQLEEERLRETDRRIRRRELWGEIGPGSMTRLARLFPALNAADGVDPWDVDRFMEWLVGPAPGSGAFWAGLFVLGVWNPTTDWSEYATTLPSRECELCAGLGKVAQEDHEPVLRGDVPGVFVRRVYNDDDEVTGTRVVETVRCKGCGGEGEYVPSLRTGRFDLFGALGSWDHAQLTAFLTWVQYPFWP
jgi:hypothetical protein